MSGDFARWVENETAAALKHDLPRPACSTCDDTGMVWIETCTCGSGIEFPHERYCGAEQCPNGCPFNPPGAGRIAREDSHP